ncbi:MAG: hypothetical protein NTX86_03680 [Candidatus Dependentiae bacterium]|nr:hypothetical protein [Candidatus Dependentiae bacterium]
MKLKHLFFLLTLICLPIILHTRTKKSEKEKLPAYCSASQKPSVRKQQKESPIVSPASLVKTDVPSIKQAQKIAPKVEQTITINDACFGKETFGYYKFMMWHYPNKFELTCNGTLILTFNGQKVTRIANTVTADLTKPLKFRFDWEFQGGSRNGWKEASYQVASTTQELTIDFDWKNEPAQILVSPATLLEPINSYKNK